MTKSDVTAGVTAGVPAHATKPKKLKRVRKKPSDDSSRTTADVASALASSSLGMGVGKALKASKLYWVFLLIRFGLMFITPATLEGTEFADGVDVLAVKLLPGMQKEGIVAPDGLQLDGNRTRSIVGGFVSSGIPYMGVNVLCNHVVGGCNEEWVGWFALYSPRLWMFMLSLIGDLLFLRCFAVYEGENAVSGLELYASCWTSLLGMSRNCNFALESLCVSGLVAGCFGWPVNVARPIFWLGGSALAFGVFLRPPFAFFVFTPMIYLMSLWGKNGVEGLRYLRASLEGIAVFALWCTVWVTVDSVYYGTFLLKFGDEVMTSFEMFVEYACKGLPFSYQGSLVITPLNAMREVVNRKFISTLAMNTSPGQMFLSLPAILGPLFLVVLRESYEGFKVAMKELMNDMKQVANAKKTKRKKPKKPGMTKEIEDELYVYFDTIQTTFLLGLLIEVVQQNDRLGTISLMSLITPCIICIAGTIFGAGSSYRFRILHLVFTGCMVIFYGFLNQSGIARVMMSAGGGGAELIPYNADVVVYRGIIGHRSLLGANVKNVSFHDGGDSRFKLMTTLRELKSRDGYKEELLIVCAAATVEMKEGEFELIGKLATGHMTSLDLPMNIDDAFGRAKLLGWRFVGDEDEAIIQDDEEAAEKEEREREEKEDKEREKRRRKERGGVKEEL